MDVKGNIMKCHLCKTSTPGYFFKDAYLTLSRLGPPYEVGMHEWKQDEQRFDYDLCDHCEDEIMKKIVELTR